MNLDHIAIESSDIQKSVSWYCETLKGLVVYQDKTWALIDVNGTRIAFVRKMQHPPHIGFNVSLDYLKKNFSEDKIKEHRDRSIYVYIEDPDGHVVEFVNWDSANNEKSV